LASPAFRANLPAGFADANFDATRANATFRALLETLVRTADCEPILERFAEDFVTSRRPDLSGTLEERIDAAAITPATAVAPRPHLVFRLRDEGENVALLFGSTTLTFPAVVREPLAFALQGSAFVVRDLPGRLDDAGKVVLARRLIKEGLLVRRTAAAYGAR